MKKIFGLMIIIFLSDGLICRAVSNDSVVSSGSALSVEIVVGTGMDGRDVVGAADQFSNETPQLVGWTRVTGAKQPLEIRHVWKCDGKDLSSVPLNVQSSSFRTYSRKNIFGKSGAWTLEVQDVDGNVLASKSFEVTNSIAK